MKSEHDDGVRGKRDAALRAVQNAFDAWYAAMKADDPRRHALWAAFNDAVGACERVKA